MSESFFYSAAIQKHAQRYVRCIYSRSELGHFKFSSTMSLMYYEKGYWGVIAYHALSKDNSLIDMYYKNNQGDFIPLDKLFIRTEFYPEEDVVIGFWGLDKEKILNFFAFNNNLDTNFNWCGFPATWAKSQYASNTTAESIRDKYISHDGQNYKISDSKYLIISATIKSNSNRNKVIGHYDHKKLELEKKGKMSEGPKLSGMSGGALFHINHLDEAQKLSFDELAENLDKYFSFVGIGLEWNKQEKEIRGLSKDRLRDLFNSFCSKLQENPIDFISIKKPS